LLSEHVRKGVICSLLLGLAACGRAPESGPSAPAVPAAAKPAFAANPVRSRELFPPPHPQLSERAALGRQIFFDASLSASGRQSCASCHDPAHAYAPANALAVQLGGPDLRQQGARAVPSLRYMDYTPYFTRHLYIPDVEGVEDEGMAGGFMRDGRVNTLHEQASLPLLNPVEMANASPADFSARLAKAPYAGSVRRLFGATVFSVPAQALAAAGQALESFETEDDSFHPYTSKFDAVLSGRAQFTPQELHGFALFNNPDKGNCASCHLDAPGVGGRPPQFTDYSFVALGVPRNAGISANHDPSHFDLGVCDRPDMQKETVYCGYFKTPTLRNIATRQAFFHNGRFHSLDEVMHFYVERDTQPGKWYPKVHGKVVKFDDMPQKYRDNVDNFRVPMNRHPGQAPALDEAEIAAVIAFMKTLDDGFMPHP